MKNIFKLLKWHLFVHIVGYSNKKIQNARAGRAAWWPYGY